MPDRPGWGAAGGSARDVRPTVATGPAPDVELARAVAAVERRLARRVLRRTVAELSLRHGLPGRWGLAGPASTLDLATPRADARTLHPAARTLATTTGRLRRAGRDLPVRLEVVCASHLAIMMRLAVTAGDEPGVGLAGGAGAGGEAADATHAEVVLRLLARELETWGRAIAEAVDSRR
jgi:hypothetical protein